MGPPGFEPGTTRDLRLSRVCLVRPMRPLGLGIMPLDYGPVAVLHRRVFFKTFAYVVVERRLVSTPPALYAPWRILLHRFATFLLLATRHGLLCSPLRKLIRVAIYTAGAVV